MSFNQLDERFRQAQALASVVALDVLSKTPGPSMALLTLRAAYAEALRAIRTQVPESQMPQLLADQHLIELQFDREMKPVLDNARRNNGP